MNKPTILIAGKWETNFLTLREFDNHHTAWAITEVATAEEAIEKFHQQDFEIAILTDRISGEEEKKLRRIFSFQNPETIIIRYHESNETLLADQLLSALNTSPQSKKAFFYICGRCPEKCGVEYYCSVASSRSRSVPCGRYPVWMVVLLFGIALQP